MASPDPSQDSMDSTVQKILSIIEGSIDSGDIYNKLTQNGTSTVSGLGANYFHDGSPEFILNKRNPIPEELTMQLRNMRSQFSMGLFTEISRAWIVIDNDIFLWNYETNDDLAYFDAVQNTVFKIALVKLRHGVYTQDFNYGLVVGTVADLTIYPMCVDDSNDNVAIDPVHFFKVCLENKTINDIVSTDEGRVFFTADDKLYEFVYENQKGWFGLREDKKCRIIDQTTSIMSTLMPFFGSNSEDLEQIAIDKSRHLMYCLGKNGSIQVYDLGVDGQQFRHTCGLQAGAIAGQANHLTQYGQESSSFNNIVSICALDAHQSNQLNLIAVTAKGVRLYFSVVDRVLRPVSQGMSQYANKHLTQSEVRAQTLRVSHVRFTHGAVPQSLSRDDKHGVAVAYADQGTCVMATVNPQSVVAVSDLHYPNTSMLKESKTGLDVSGYVWAISPVVEKMLPAPLTDKLLVPRVLPHAFNQQPILGKSRLIVCSNEYVHEFLQLTPVELLGRALQESGADGRAVAELLRDFGHTELLVMALQILVSDVPCDDRIKEKAAALFYSMKDTPRMVDPAMDRSAAGDSEWTKDDSIAQWKIKMPSPLQASTPRYTNYASPGVINSPAFSTSMSASFGGPSLERYSATHRHDALYRYISRLLTPIWTQPICKVNGKTLTTVLSVREMEWLSNELRKLVAVMEKYRLLPAVDPPFSNNPAGRVNSEASNLERLSLQALRRVAQLAAETLSLWSIANSFDLQAISASLDAAARNSLASRNFYQLVSVNCHFSGDLIRAMISFFLGDEAGTRNLSDRLRRECPSLYSADDACVTNAMELLTKADSTGAGPLRRKLVDGAFEMFCQSIVKVDLATVCRHLKKLNGFEQIVDLCLLRALRDDPKQLANVAYSCDFGRASLDDREMAMAEEKRLRAYSVLCDLLTELDENAEMRSATSAEDGVHRDLMMARIIASDDELAHASLFRWMLDRKKSNQILQSKSPFVEQFLTRELSAGRGHTHTYLDLLWRWYEKSGNYDKATALLSRLADDDNRSINLEQRFAYLSHAVICARCGDEMKTRAQIEDLKDKIEVARVQMAILDCLKSLNPSNPSAMEREAMRSLDGPVLSLQDLLVRYAGPYNLHRIKLQIFHCASLYDEATICNVWENILDAELDTDGDVSERLRGTILEMGALFGRNKYFPIEYIMSRLLARGAGMGGRRGVVIGPMFFVGLVADLAAVKYTPTEFLKLLLEEYRDGDPFWSQNAAGQKYIVEVGIAMVEAVLKDSGRRSNTAFGDCEALLSAFQLDARDVAAPSSLRQYSNRLDHLQQRLQHTGR